MNRIQIQMLSLLWLKVTFMTMPGFHKIFGLGTRILSDRFANIADPDETASGIPLGIKGFAMQFDNISLTHRIPPF